MPVSSALESHIDELYRAPLEHFTTARNALAKTLSGADAGRVKKLPKPTVGPWAANQLYWKARGTYDRLLKSGERLRNAQLGALEGRAADLRPATEAHRKALGDAVQEAGRLAAAADTHPAPDALMRTFEALSLMRSSPAPPGRLTEALQPAGFEALAGVPIRPSNVRLKPDATTGSASVRSVRLQPDVPKADPRKDAEARQREAAAATKHEAAIRKAEAEIVRAKAAATLARAALERADHAVQNAEAELKRLRAQRT